MKLFVTILGSILLLAVAAFCVFGFLATFEPTDKTTQFMASRIVYGLVGVGCLVGVFVLILRSMSQRDDRSP